MMYSEDILMKRDFIGGFHFDIVAMSLEDISSAEYKAHNEYYLDSGPKFSM